MTHPFELRPAERGAVRELTPSDLHADPRVEASLAALWHALRARAMDTADLSALRPHVRGVARAGRAAGLPPEHLLPVLKASWYALPEAHRVEPPASYFTTGDQLGRIVTLCIEEYFAGSQRADD